MQTDVYLSLSQHGIKQCLVSCIIVFYDCVKLCEKHIPWNFLQNRTKPFTSKQSNPLFLLLIVIWLFYIHQTEHQSLYLIMQADTSNGASCHRWCCQWCHEQFICHHHCRELQQCLVSCFHSDGWWSKNEV